MQNNVWFNHNHNSELKESTFREEQEPHIIKYIVPEKQIQPINREYVKREASAIKDRGENRLQKLKEQMRSNLKSVKDTKARLNLKKDIGELEETEEPARNQSPDSPKAMNKLVPGLKDQVLKFSQRLERMLESKK
jgi:hypothetical protein